MGPDPADAGWRRRRRGAEPVESAEPVGDGAEAVVERAAEK